MDILMDGGIRSGSDVVVALASGAKAVQVGRAYAYGLGAGGEAGVRRAFTILETTWTTRCGSWGVGRSRDHASHCADYPFG